MTVSVLETSGNLRQGPHDGMWVPMMGKSRLVIQEYLRQALSPSYKIKKGEMWGAGYALPPLADVVGMENKTLCLHIP